MCSALDCAQADALRAELHTHTLHLIQLGSQYERDCAEAKKDRLYAAELQLRQLRLLRERGLALYACAARITPREAPCAEKGLPRAERVGAT